MEFKLSFSIGTFLTNNDNINELYLPETYSIVQKWEIHTAMETTKFNTGLFSSLKAVSKLV